MDDLPIFFYSGSTTHYQFSNFYLSPIFMDDEWFPTGEHAYHYAKVESKKARAKILSAKTPKEAMRIGNMKRSKIRPDWDIIKDGVMYEVMKAKFDTHMELRMMLMNTGDRKLIHWAPWDPYWGTGENGQGLNMMGVLLMDLRQDYLHKWVKGDDDMWLK